MASTNKTTNYELSQFIETDRPAWLTDYNGDMRTIDSTMKAISDVASGASGSISELADRMSTAEGNITTNANDIDALEARADSLEAQAQSTAGTIANIQTEQTAQNLGIEAATELGYNLARPYDSASTYAVGAYVLFQNTLYKCITAIATGEAFDPSKWLAIKATDEIAAGGYTLPIASASTLGGVKVGDNLSIDPVTGILSASGGNDNIEIKHYIANNIFIFDPNVSNNVTTFRSQTLNDWTTTSHTTTNDVIQNCQIHTIKNSDIVIIKIVLYLSYDLIDVGTSPRVLDKTSALLKLNPNYTNYNELNEIFGSIDTASIVYLSTQTASGFYSKAEYLYNNSQFRIRERVLQIAHASQYPNNAVSSDTYGDCVIIAKLTQP